MATYNIDKPFTLDSYTMVLSHCEKSPSSNTDGVSINYCIEDNTLLEDDSNILFVTKFKKFGTFSVKAPNNANCLVKYGPLGTTNNTLLLNTNNWTIEMWVYRDSEAAQGIFEIENKIQVNINNNGYLTLDDKILNTKFKTIYTSQFKLEKSTWHHIAVVRYSDELQIYVDGIQSGVLFGYSGINFSTDATYLMIGGTSTNRSPNLYFDEIRVSKTARYNAIEIFENNFSNYTNDADELRYTKSILHFNDANNPGKDDYNRNWIIKGLPELVTEGAKFTKALSLTRDSQLESKDGIEFGGKDFTIDFWTKLNSTTASDGTIFSASLNSGRNIGDNIKKDYIAISRSATTNYLKLQLYGSDSSSLLYTLNTDTDKDYIDSKQFNTSIINSLIHCALVYQHSEQTITFYINGVSQYTLNEVNIRRVKRYITLGRGKISDNNYMIGTIDEFRISDGIARWTENFTAPTAPYEVDENTKSLLHFNEKIEKDEIGNTWILSQPTVISSENAKFSKALQLNGNGLYLKHDGNFEFGGKNFTIEGWACVNSVSNYSRIFEFSTADDNYSQLIALWRNGTTNKFQFVYYYNTTQYVVNTVSDIPLGEIFHFAMVYNYNSRVLMGFINGVKQGQVSITGIRTNYSSVTFGYPNISDHTYLNGTIDDVRITDGIARYSADFTVPTTAYVRKTKSTITVNKFSYTNLNIKDFKSDYEVRALLHFDNENNPVKDEYNNTWNYAGTPIITQTNAISDNAVYMNNSINDYKLQNLILGGKDFTIDYWVTYTNRSIFESVQLRYSTPTEDNNIGLLGVQSGNKASNITVFYYGTEDSKSKAVSIASSSPTHIALVYTHEDTKLKLYANGVLKSTVTVEIPTNNYDVVFTNSKNTVYGATGTYDEFRISDGIARWTENFTPPQGEYTKDKYTKALLHFNNKNDIFKDECDNAWETNTKLEISTSRKIGTSGLYLDGENYIYLPISEKFDLSDDVDFTIDWWEYKINEDIGNSVLSIEPVGGNSSNHSIILGWYEDSKYKVLINDKSAEYELGEIKLGEWIHRAFVKSENQYLCFEDGVLVHTYDANTLPQYNSTYQLIIGKANGIYSKGYIDELRISIGVARWVDNFTPTTKSYDKDNETVALLHFDEVNNPYKDMCNNSWVSNLAKVATTNAKFNNALQISHTNRFVEYDGSFTIGGKDFTIDFWMFMDPSTGKNGRVFSFFYNIGTSSNRFFLSRNGEGNTLIMYKNTSHSNASTSDIIGKLVHVAVTYQHAITTLSLFINGIKEVSWNCGTFTQYNYPKFAIARTEIPDTDGEFIGSIDEFRITDGISMYINNYTPPTEPYNIKSVSNPKTDEWNSNIYTVNRNDRTYYDKVLDDKKYKVSPIAMRFQKKGLYATDYLVNFFKYEFVKDLKYTGKENFTVETCIYMPSTYSIVREIFNLKFDSKNYLNIYLNTGNKYEISMNDEVKYTYPTIPITKTWHHLALVRYGTDLYFYVDKKKICIIATDFDVDFTKMKSADLIIGKNYNVSYLLFDNIRVTNSARYIA